MTIRILIADDHAVLRDGLKALLGAKDDLEVVAEASNGQEAASKAIETDPDVVVMDVSMPIMNGIEGTRLIAARHPASRVIILSMHSSTEHVYGAFDAGASGYVLKECAGAEIEIAIRTVHAGGRFVSSRIGRLDFGRHGGGPLHRLSGRERQVLQLVVEGHSSTEVAERVHLSPKSVATYRSRLMQKLDLHDFAALVKFAVEHGITPSA